MKNFSIYYIVHVAINIALLIIFRTNIIIDLMSILPVFLIALMLIQAPMFKVDIHRSSVGDTAYSTGNTVRLTDDELEKQYKYTRYSFYGLIPFVFPFIFFFSSYAKKNYRMCFREPDGQNLPHCFIVPDSAYSDSLWDWDSRLSTLS